MVHSLFIVMKFRKTYRLTRSHSGNRRASNTCATPPPPLITIPCFVHVPSLRDKTIENWNEIKTYKMTWCTECTYMLSMCTRFPISEICCVCKIYFNQTFFEIEWIQHAISNFTHYSKKQFHLRILNTEYRMPNTVLTTIVYKFTMTHDDYCETPQVFFFLVAVFLFVYIRISSL